MPERHICIDEEVIESIVFKDGDQVLGTLRCDGSQSCTNGYKFEITYKKTIEKED